MLKRPKSDIEEFPLAYVEEDEASTVEPISDSVEEEPAAAAAVLSCSCNGKAPSSCC